MAEFFTKFDCLPVDHSHGNLCAWRGILDLYGITGNRTYLDRAKAKWDAAVKGGFVWPLGGVGEHWYVFFSGDEGCSESDWLRFSLDLWRFTGQTRYLDIAERLLENQYATNQCPNGGYGMAHLDGDAAGPVAAIEQIDEWPFCCSFHGPLGLHFLKGYLAVGGERGVIVNFPYDFNAPVKAAGREWLVSVRSKSGLHRRPDTKWRSSLRRGTRPRPAVATLGADARRGLPPLRSSPASGEAGAGHLPRAAICGSHGEFKAGEKLTVDFQNTLVLEGRRFQKVPVAAGYVSRVKDVAVLAGPELSSPRPSRAAGGRCCLATLDAAGRLELPRDKRRRATSVTVALPGIEANDAQIAPGRPIRAAGLPAHVAGNRCFPAWRSCVCFGRGNERHGQIDQREAAASALHVRSRGRACGLPGRGPRQAGRPGERTTSRAGRADLRHEPGETARELVEQCRAGSSRPRDCWSPVATSA